MDIFLYILFLAALLFTVAAQIKVSTTFNRYSRIAVGRGQTGAEVARRILDAHGLFHIRIERVEGHLSDHYDPRAGVLRLSRGVHDASTSAAVGVAAHEVGHAIQHAEKYMPIVIRSKLVPAVSFASRFAWIAIILGIIVTYFSYVFKKLNGISLWKYISIKRVERAIELLQAEHISRLEIAERCGFSSSSNFYKTFTALTGKTPGDYARRE